MWMRLASFAGVLLFGMGSLVFAENQGGSFVREYWYKSGIEYGNPTFNSRFRVNAPETGLSRFADRAEARASGMMQIFMEEDLRLLSSAVLYSEMWGGHPGTAKKRVTLNGRSTYPLPEVGTEQDHCTYSYPYIPLKITDLVNGYNALQFACDQGSTFWGHYLVDNACLVAFLKPDHPDLKMGGLDSFSVQMDYTQEGERIRVTLHIPELMSDRIARVDFYGLYEGYDENGDGQNHDVHGITKNRLPQAILGSAEKTPFQVEWDTRMLPGQEKMAACAKIYFKEPENLAYWTAFPGKTLATPERERVQVRMLTSSDLPRPFWSRANQAKQCTINLDIELETIEKAELHVVIWDGGRGNVEQPFTLNGHPLPVAGEGKHDVLYRVIPVEPAILKQGANTIQVLSDTEHHGIEVLLPGPALMIRYKK